MNCGECFWTLLNKSNSWANRGIGINVAHIKVSSACEPATKIGDLAKQLEQSSWWLFEWQRHDGFIDIINRRIKINKFTGVDVNLTTADTTL